MKPYAPNGIQGTRFGNDTVSGIQQFSLQIRVLPELCPVCSFNDFVSGIRPNFIVIRSDLLSECFTFVRGICS